MELISCVGMRVEEVWNIEAEVNGKCGVNRWEAVVADSPLVEGVSERSLDGKSWSVLLFCQSEVTLLHPSSLGRGHELGWSSTKSSPVKSEKSVERSKNRMLLLLPSTPGQHLDLS